MSSPEFINTVAAPLALLAIIALLALIYNQSR